MSATAGGTEVELKYRVADPAAFRAWLEDEGTLRSLGGSWMGTWRELQLEDRYLDTADGRLATAGYAARLRASQEGVLLGLKSLATFGDGRAALHRRREEEGAASDDLDPVGWPPSPARSLLLELTGDGQLGLRSSIRQHRRERDLRLGGGSTVQLSLQEAEVVHGGRTLGRQDALEVELRDGGEGGLDELARALEASGLLEVDPRSKEAWARDLIGAADAATAGLDGQGRETPQSRAAPGDGVGTAEAQAPSGPGVAAEDPLAEAGRKVLAFHLARMLEQEDGVRAGHDTEAVHKMRVATRRMRAAWNVFGDAFPARDVRRYTKELRGVASRLGAVRDLDVLLEATEREAGDSSAVRPLIGAWRQQRETAQEALRRALDSAAYRRFVVDYRTFTEATPELAGRSNVIVRPTVSEVAGDRIRRAYAKVHAHEAVLGLADEATLHEIRIRGKRLRYTLEFFREPLGPGCEPLIATVTELQDRLGTMNDAAIAGRMAREFLIANAADLPPESVAAIGAYVATREGQIRKGRKLLGPLWDRLMGPSFRDGLAEAIEGLS